MAKQIICSLHKSHLGSFSIYHFTCSRIRVPALSCTFLPVKVWSSNTSNFFFSICLRIDNDKNYCISSVLHPLFLLSLLLMATVYHLVPMELLCAEYIFSILLKHILICVCFQGRLFWGHKSFWSLLVRQKDPSFILLLKV